MPESSLKALFSDEDIAEATETQVVTKVAAPSSSSTEALSRSEKMSQTRADKMRALFQGKKYKILGEVHLSKDDGEQFQTPFGNKGRNGFVLKEDETGSKIIVGEAVLRKADEQYSSILNLPPAKPKRSRRTKAQKAEDDAARAAAQAIAQEKILSRYDEV